MRIQHNIMSMNAYRYYSNNNKALSTNLEKLSSGYKINRAADDAAGLAISEKMRAEIKGLETAESNAQSGINLVQTAEGALTEVHDMLNRMVELADESANGTYDDDTDRANLQKEFEQLSSEIDRIADASNFNGQNLFDGTLADATAATGKVVMNLSGITTGDSVTVNGKTYEIGTGTDTATKFYVADKSALVTKIADDSDIASAAFGTGTEADVLTITSETSGKDGDVTSTAAATVNSKSVTDITVTKGKDASTKLTLQIGGTADSYNKITLSINDMHTSYLGKNVKIGTDGYVSSSDGLLSEQKIDTQANAETAVDVIKSAIDQVSETRGSLGATQNRLEHTINNLTVMVENIQDAESNIRDVDVAEEMMDYTKNSILVQSAQSMLAQANQAPQNVLQLLQ